LNGPGEGGDITSFAKRGRSAGFIAALIVLCFGSLGVFFFARDAYSGNQIHQLIDAAYSGQRPGGGRLSGTPYAPLLHQASAAQELGKAQLLLLQQPRLKNHQTLQGLLYLAAGNWQKFVESTNQADPKTSGNAGALNNLGASFLALAGNDPAFLLKAQDAFESALKSDPKAVEPRFNLVVLFRKLRFHNLAENALHAYAGRDEKSDWYHELANPEHIDEGGIVDQLRTAVESNNLVEAERLFDDNPELCRRVAMQYATSDEEESSALLHFIASQMERRYGDRTISAMLAPLFSDSKDRTVEIRKDVKAGADAYLAENYPASLEAYTHAKQLALQTDSVFDRLWIDLNLVDTLIRLARFDEAKQSLEHLVTISRKERFIWLAARGLSIYGSTVRLTPSYDNMINLLTEANQSFLDLDAPHDRIRVLYYLAAYRYAAGDQDGALSLALECLCLTNDDAASASKIATLDWLIGSILYRHGMAEKAILFANESVARSHESAGIEFTTASTLSDLYESMSQHDQADRYLKVAEDAFKKVPDGFDRDKGALWLGIVKARSEIHRKQFNQAEAVLQENLRISSQLPFNASTHLSQSLMLLAQVYADTGRTSEASKKYDEAIQVVEDDDQYLKSESLRVKFDDSRRELYDSAIEFAFDQGNPDAAWVYLQKYRAKLFLEFLAEFNPDIEQTRANPDPSSTQHRIPKDSQILEYALLKDRLLIWVMTDSLFTVRSVPVKRDEVEAQVEAVLKKLRGEADADALLSELGSVLIEPVSNLLDPNRTLVIIPDRALHGLPFSALRRPGDGRYLIQEFPVVVSPSLTHFLAANERIPDTPRNAIVEFGSQNGGASELKELNALAMLYKSSTLYSGQQVNKATFLGAMNKAEIFHYAGHSATDAIDPLRSSILLDGNRSGPNSVTAVDISRQRLPGNAVVILSSCDSSVGNSRDGIGVRGLTSAFLIGGAGSVVGSLWPVEGSSTADLMIQFHRAFALDHMPVAQALRTAQLSFLQSTPERAHPYYWSGFVVTGNFSALR
jgi:CHAT domain-containing protein